MPISKKGIENTNDLNLRDLPKPQKIAVIILAIIAVLVVVFWIWQIKTQINSPFGAPNNNSSETATSTDIDAVLKGRDTDSDGLSDYDEIYVYKTSPYLEDTDSDGLSDKKEIDVGSDPNCPKGKECNGLDNIATSTSSNNINSSVGGAVIPDANLDASGVNNDSLQKALNGQIDAATLRQLLISSGASKSDLDKISDTDLMKSYQETLKNQNQNATTTK